MEADVVAAHPAAAGRTGEHDRRTADVRRAGQEAGKRQASDVAVAGGDPETVSIDTGADPLISTRGAPTYPGCVVPSITIGSVIRGNSVLSAMTCGPAPGIAKLTSSTPARVLAVMIASRSDPGPLSAVLVTVSAPRPGCTIHDGGDIVDERLRALEPVGDDELGFAVVREVAGRNASWGVAGSLRLGRGKGARASAVQDGDVVVSAGFAVAMSMCPSLLTSAAVRLSGPAESA